MCNRHNDTIPFLSLIQLCMSFSNAGGGGERVLWTAVAHMQRTHPDIMCVIYSGDKGVGKEDIIEKVKVYLLVTRSFNC